MSERKYEKIFRSLTNIIIFVVLPIVVALTLDMVGYKYLKRSLCDSVGQDPSNLYESISNSCALTMVDSTLEIKAAFIDSYQYVEEETVELDRPMSDYDLYNSYVDEIINQHYPSLDAECVKAIIYHESRYDPNAYNSKTGVIGLMQINPKWHTKRALDLGVTDLYDPYGNILVGCDILNELTKQYSFNYAINFFAGGYSYADAYTELESPYMKSLKQIILGFHTGAIYMGGE